LVLGTLIAIAFRVKQRRKDRQQSQTKTPSLNEDGTVQDQQGNWWYQDPVSGAWSSWDGESWQVAQAGPALPPAPPSQESSIKPKGKGCLASMMTVVILSVLVLGGFTVVALGYIPRLTIHPAATVNLYELLKIGGGGLILALAGTLLLRGGFASITARRAKAEDESSQGREKPGCLKTLGGLVLITLGLIALTAGLGLIALAVYQQVLPLSGYSLG
jgi:hypothetical protein